MTASIDRYICNFIDSKDIREYLRKIEYSFSPVQYAYLIWQSRRHAFFEKKSEWMRMIDCVPDCGVLIGKENQGWDSLHQMVKAYIALKEKMHDRLCRCGENAVYEYRCLENGNWCSDGGIYRTYDACVSHAMEDAEGEKADFEVRKKYFENEGKSTYIVAQYNSKSDWLDIDIFGDFGGILTHEEENLFFYSFDEMWFDFPIPFEKGDIVCDCFKKKPFVLMETVPWSKKERPPKREDWRNYMTHMDMNASGYSYDACTCFLLDDWADYKYLNLEYYPDQLHGGERLLTVYGLFEKGKIDAFSMLKLYRFISAEETAKAERREIKSFLRHDICEELDIGQERGG